MTNFSFYNACMEIATRMNRLFSKSFVFHVSNEYQLWIDATPIYNIFSAPYNIHMVGNRVHNALEVYLNFEQIYDISQNDKDWFEMIAYELGHDIAERFAITRNRNGFIFFFPEDTNYPSYKDHFEYILDGEYREETTDYPLVHHMKTEFDAEFTILNEENLDGPISELKKNGSPMFDIVKFMNQRTWGIVRIEKDGCNYNIVRQGQNDFFRKSFFKVLPYIAQYAELEKIPMFKKKANLNPFVEMYFSFDDESYDVLLERVRNYGLSHDDLQAAMTSICDEFEVRSDINWANKISRL